MATTSSAVETADFAVRYALISDPGTERGNNEDAAGSYEETPTHVLVVVADGVGGEDGGEVASQMALDVTLRAYKESPASWGPAKRLYRAVQQANIEIHDRALVVTELRRMSTTVTAIVVHDGILYAAHIGDTRLYLLRSGTITQKTKDHTVAASHQRMGFISATRAKHHPERSTLTRSVGRDLIVAVDRITFPLAGGDVLVVCSDGLYNVLEDDELRSAADVEDPDAICRSMIHAANERGAPDNVTAAVVRVTGTAPQALSPSGWRAWLARLVGH
jgi:serine/threonine protein phosphatase PrpC